MTLQQVGLLVLGAVVLIGLPIFLIASMVAHFRTRASERPGSGSQTAGIGAAMQELDRLLARPSAEHIVEAQNPVLRREDDESGE
jgi:hypothetical protein